MKLLFQKGVNQPSKNTVDKLSMKTNLKDDFNYILHERLQEDGQSNWVNDRNFLSRSFTRIISL